MNQDLLKPGDRKPYQETALSGFLTLKILLHRHMHTLFSKTSFKFFFPKKN